MNTIEINGTTITKHEQPAASVTEMVGRTADAMRNGLWTDRNAAVQTILLAMDAALFVGRNDTRFAMLGSKLCDIALDALRLQAEYLAMQKATITPEASSDFAAQSAVEAIATVDLTELPRRKPTFAFLERNEEEPAPVLDDPFEDRFFD